MRAIATAILLTLAAVVQADALFTESEPLRLTLTGPLEQIVDDAEARIELPFVLTIGETQVPVEVRTRGKSRLRVCRFPPLRLDFGRDGDVASAFSGYDKIKLVTHCRDKSKDDDAFAERTGTEYRELPGVVYSKLDDAHATLVYVFQYLIGNTDWSLVLADGDDKCCHNGDLFEADSGLLLVPYDFDLAGIVDASYAKPDPSLRIRSVRSRLYRGYCTDPGTVRAALEAAVARQAPIMELAKTTPAASPDDLEERIDYLQEFFEEAEDLEDMLETFERRCIG